MYSQIMFVDILWIYFLLYLLYQIFGPFLLLFSEICLITCIIVTVTLTKMLVYFTSYFEKCISCGIFINSFCWIVEMYKVKSWSLWTLVWDFDLLWPLILIQLFWLFMVGLDESW